MFTLQFQYADDYSRNCRVYEDEEEEKEGEQGEEIQLQPHTQ